MPRKPREVDPPIVFRARYAGERSQDFWDAVKKLKGADNEAAYMLGIALQELEARVLQFVVNAQERPQRRPTRRRA